MGNRSSAPKNASGGFEGVGLDGVVSSPGEPGKSLRSGSDKDGGKSRNPRPGDFGTHMGSSPTKIAPAPSLAPPDVMTVSGTRSPASDVSKRKHERALDGVRQASPVEDVICGLEGSEPSFVEGQETKQENLDSRIAEPSITDNQSQSSSFDFTLTEGQTRRTMMADYEFECSEVAPGLFVSGAKVAGDREILRRNGIRKIVNCAASVIPCFFTDESLEEGGLEGVVPGGKQFEYLALHMVDGRQDDISWFVCEVLHFITSALQANQKVLVHCEKGISRSCSFIICLLVWREKLAWKAAFELVKASRPVCNPNTAFTCQIIEWAELIQGSMRTVHMLLRLATHLPHDLHRPVLKLIRDENTRRVIAPRYALLDPRGIFVLRVGLPEVDEESSQPLPPAVYVWVGSRADSTAVGPALRLAGLMLAILGPSGRSVLEVKAGQEPKDFLSLLVSEELPANPYSDLFGHPQPLANTPVKPAKPARPPLARPGSSSGSTPTSRPGSNTGQTSRPSSAAKLRSGSADSTGSAQNLSLLSDEHRKHTPTARIGRTPSAGKLPEDVALARGPTPVDDLDGEASARSRESLGASGVKEDEPLLHNANATQAAAQAILEPSGNLSSKPKLFLCTDENGHAEWEGMGIYDDDDLEESLLLLLHCPEGPNFLWLGKEYSDSHDEICGDDQKLLEWVCAEVAAGENSRWVDVFPCDVRLERSGEESDEFWDQFNEGF